MFGPLSNLNFIEEITYLTPPPESNEKHARMQTWAMGLRHPHPPASLVVIEISF